MAFFIRIEIFAIMARANPAVLLYITLAKMAGLLYTERYCIGMFCPVTLCQPGVSKFTFLEMTLRTYIYILPMAANVSPTIYLYHAHSARCALDFSHLQQIFNLFTDLPTSLHSQEVYRYQYKSKNGVGKSWHNLL